MLVILLVFLLCKFRKKIYFILIFLTVILVPPKFSNSCESYTAYLNIFFSSECYYDPDVDDDVVSNTKNIFEKKNMFLIVWDNSETYRIQ